MNALLRFVCVIVLFLLAVLFGGVKVDEYICHTKWGDSGLSVKYGPLAGCRVSEDGKTWIPEDRYRVIE